MWPETSRNSSARRGVLVVATAVALFLAYLLGDAIDVTASKAFSAIYVPAAAFLVIAAAYDLRLTAIIVPPATVMLMIVHILSLYAHFPVS